jgi:8-oxo-dGTP pyrophosphatase MutT (NUDIX family)
MSAALVRRLRLSLERPGGAPLMPGDDIEIDPAIPAVPAAVLIAVTRAERPEVILTVRREGLRTHGGQVAFPGGRIDPGEDALAAALREANEELGLEPAGVEVLGTLAPYRTVTDYLVTPVIGLIDPDPALAPHEPEVADWFAAPLDYLLDPANQQRRTTLFRGRDRHYVEINWNGRRIWGATAAMIVNLTARLEWS